MSTSNKSSNGGYAVTKTRTRSNPRSRSGCTTCKAKHTKCDETRPHCLTCTNKGLTCGGYRRELKWSSKHQPPNPRGCSPPESRSAGPVVSSAPPSGTALLGADAELAMLDAYLDPDAARQAVDDVLRDLLPLPLSLPGDAAWMATPYVEPWAADLGSDSDLSSLSPPPSMDCLAESPPRPMFDSATLLMTSWFSDVCPAWSAFDSGANWNRRLAVELWQDSPAVFGAMQAMSAAFLSTRLPHMHRPALELMQRATEAVQTEAQAVHALPRLETLPSGLLFSLFCLGTTVCWVDARQLGLPFLREAKVLLRRLNNECAPSTRDHRELLSFFNKSLMYCEALLTAAGNDDLLAETGADGAVEARAAPETPSNVVSSPPHPWTGISTVPFQLFAQSVRLCRVFRSNMRRRQNTEKSLETALRDIQCARRLEEQLLELEATSKPAAAAAAARETGDDKTPWLHLERIAEAYQLASLLQLYQTFPDLVATRLPREAEPSAAAGPGGSVPWERWITPLSLRLLGVLGQIPADSGTRVVQPLLYITASTGLRHDASTTAEALLKPPAHQQAPPPCLLGHVQSLADVPRRLHDTPMPRLISQAALDIGEARHFVMSRMATLESSLPPRPIVMARALIQAIWDSYDAEMPGAMAVHWVDVMEDKDLRSMFG